MYLMQTLRLRQVQRQVLTARQRLQVQHLLAQRMEHLARDIRDEKYEPEKVNCKSCGHTMTHEDILSGFLEDPHDHTTCCPKCDKRFKVNLVSHNRIYIAYLCASQTLYALQNLYRCSPKTIGKKHPSVYRSALDHFSTLNEAFAKLGRKYRFKPIHTWNAKVVLYLGKMPDTHIANCVHVPVRKVRELRHSLNIPRYLKSQEF